MATEQFRIDYKGLCPEFDHGEEVILAGVGERIDSRVVFGRKIAPVEVRRFEMEWENATQGQVFLVDQLFDTLGKTGVMDMIPVDESSVIEVRFASDIEVEQTGALTHRMRFTLEEAIGCLV